MNQENQDDVIKELFEELNQEYEQSRPSFQAMRQAALGRQARSSLTGRLLRSAAIVTVPLILIAALVFFLTGRPALDSGELSAELTRGWPPWQGIQRTASTLPSITQWQSPTQALLRSPGDEILRQVPSLGELLLDETGLPEKQEN